MTGQFLTKLCFEDLLNRKFRLLSPLVYRAGDGAIITVPENFVTDLASIPRGLWNILPPIGNYDAAAVLHDRNYTIQDMSRSRADALLREAMEVCGVGRVTRALIWSGVRAGGWKAWRQHTAELKMSE